MSKPAKVRFALTVEAAPGDGTAAPTYRLRRALKCLLRSFGLRCIDAKELPAQDRQDHRQAGDGKREKP